MADINEQLDLRYQVTKDAALAGGRVLRTYFGQKLTGRRKQDDSIVTEADVAAESEVLRVIRSNFPDDLILAEEAGAVGERTPGRHIWVIDPLDGTSNFFYGLPFFCCSVGCGRVEKGGAIVMLTGAVAAPQQDELYHGAVGRGAFLNDRALCLPPATGKSFEHLFLSMGLYYGAGERLERELKLCDSITRHCQSIRRLGAAALELCMVASGVFDGYWQEGLQAWDVAAASVIIGEAGGKVSTYRAGSFDVEAGSIMAGPADVVDRLQDLI